jgi:hypothetical protein
LWYRPGRYLTDQTGQMVSQSQLEARVLKGHDFSRADKCSK